MTLDKIIKQVSYCESMALGDYEFDDRSISLTGIIRSLIDRIKEVEEELSPCIQVISGVFSAATCTSALCGGCRYREKYKISYCFLGHKGN